MTRLRSSSCVGYRSAAGNATLMTADEVIERSFRAPQRAVRLVQGHGEPGRHSLGHERAKGADVDALTAVSAPSSAALTNTAPEPELAGIIIQPRRYMQAKPGDRLRGG